jgi:DNA-binding CsgD family transcriptional regulator
MIALTCTRQRHIAVHVAPFQCATAILFLQEIGGLQPLPLELLMHIYGLTRSEARLTSLLAQDFDLEAAAAALRISRSTAKTHLEHVFHKTGTRRQSQLIRKALSPFPGAS